MPKKSSAEIASSSNLVGTSLPVEERIWAAVKKLFPMYGIRSVPIEMIATHARTNSDAVRRIFFSKEHIVVKYLRELAAEEQSNWQIFVDHYPEDPGAQLKDRIDLWQTMWTDKYFGRDELSRAAAEISHIDPGAREVIRRHKLVQLNQIARLCTKAGYREPKELADKLFMLVEGAHSASESIGYDGPTNRLVAAAETLVAAHAAQPQGAVVGGAVPNEEVL